VVTMTRRPNAIWDEEIWPRSGAPRTANAR
jgi:hypothetical protein